MAHKNFDVLLTASSRDALLACGDPHLQGRLVYKMKIMLISLWLCMSAASAFAQSVGANVSVAGVSADANVRVTRGAPAPLIGLGIPAALAVGGVLFGAKFLRRRRQSRSQGG
jgi:hypothetical protein